MERRERRGKDRRAEMRIRERRGMVGISHSTVRFIHFLSEPSPCPALHHTALPFQALFFPTPVLSISIQINSSSLYFSLLMIFRARASMSTPLNAVKGRARLRSSRTTTLSALPFSSSLSFSSPSSFLAVNKK